MHLGQIMKTITLWGMDVYCASFSAPFEILAYHTVLAQIPQKHLTTDNGLYPTQSITHDGFS